MDVQKATRCPENDVANRTCCRIVDSKKDQKDQKDRHDKTRPTRQTAKEPARPATTGPARQQKDPPDPPDSKRTRRTAGPPDRRGGRSPRHPLRLEQRQSVLGQCVDPASHAGGVHIVAHDAREVPR